MIDRRWTYEYHFSRAIRARDGGLYVYHSDKAISRTKAKHRR